jgi:D-amino-acid dehydrogenase
VADARSDVVVVGGGVVGAATAYQLCRRGLGVSVVDRRHPGWASGAGAGILSPETTHRADPAWVTLTTLAGRHYRQLTQELAEAGAPSTGFHECGLVRVAMRAGEVDFFDQDLRRVAARAPGALRAIDVAEAQERFPPLGEVAAAAYAPGAARVDGTKLCRALLAAAGRGRLTVRHEEVTAIGTSGSRVDHVVTDRGRLACGAVVLCGGAWSGRLGALVGANLPVRPMKGQIVHLRGGHRGTASWPIVQPVFGYYLVSWPRGRVTCGGTMEPGAAFDPRPTTAGLHELLREALLLAPGLGAWSLAAQRVGLRPASGDDLPVVGRLSRWENLFVATGHGTEGLLLGPVSGAWVAAELSGEVVPDALRSLGPGRFEKVSGDERDLALQEDQPR